MAGEWADQGAIKVLNAVFRNTGSLPTTVYLALLESAPADDDDLADIASKEIDDASYDRQAITFGAPAEDAGVYKIKNSSQITFGPFTSGGEEITHAAIVDAETGTDGSVYAIFTLTESKFTNASETLTIAVNDLSFGID